MAEPYLTVGSKLFLSVDLVGSTNFKQRSAEWIDSFLSFYEGFPRDLDAALDELRHNETCVPTLWKAVGDELIFTADVSDEAEIYFLVRAWLRAMELHEPGLEKSQMTTKGGAFLACFPGPDREVAIPLNPTRGDSDKYSSVRNEEALQNRDYSKFLFDYLGPSIDTGFRVLSACSPRYFTLSVEVAWAMAQHQLSINSSSSTDFSLMDERELKGVWKGRPYPLFSIDRIAGDDVVKAMRTVRAVARAEFEHVVTLAKACHNSAGWPSGIYLPKSTTPEFVAQKAGLEERQAALSAAEDDYEEPAAYLTNGGDDSETEKMAAAPVE
ncbi:hypothetical protein HQQ80_09385 [Microbacteriaceae bacterium VKM Ac-2855]|nr:hypothetical protein [Microbacteriaceae bacterium VKM Ac-2855]